jgi:hypothetical protein
LYGSDRGFFNERNVTSCERGGVKVVCIPQRGGKRTPEREAYEKSQAQEEKPDEILRRLDPDGAFGCTLPIGIDTDPRGEAPISLSTLATKTRSYAAGVVSTAVQKNRTQTV